MKEVEFRGVKRQLSDVKYLDMVEVIELREKSGLRAATKRMLVALGFTDSEVESLSLQEGLALQKAIDDTTKDFQIPTEKKE